MPTTLYPSAAILVAMAKPSPRETPVTTTALILAPQALAFFDFARFSRKTDSHFFASRALGRDSSAASLETRRASRPGSVLAPPPAIGKQGRAWRVRRMCEGDGADLRESALDGRRESPRPAPRR
jgi:hypothetical protein